MVLVFILLGIFIIFVLLTFLILLSTFHIEIKDLEATNMNEDIKEQKNIYNNKTSKKSNKHEESNNGYAIILSLYLGNKLKWISIHLNDEKLRKTYSKMQLEKIDIKKLEKDFKWEDLKVIKKLNLKISYLNLKMKLGVESPIITSFIVSIISSIISIFLPHLALKIKSEDYKYIIEPIYQNQNLYKIKFNCIIQVKMVHIINVIYILVKRKGRRDLNERTTSNRRAYGYSHE